MITYKDKQVIKRLIRLLLVLHNDVRTIKIYNSRIIFEEDTRIIFEEDMLIFDLFQYFFTDHFNFFQSIYITFFT